MPSKQQARDALGIPPDKIVLLLVAAEFNQIKLPKFAVEGVRSVKPQNLLILTLGSGSPTDWTPHESKCLGYLFEERTRHLAYRASDLLFHPAVSDNLPYAVVDALAHGVPTLSFDVGGLPDLVKNGYTGWRITDMTAAGVQEGFASALPVLADSKWSINCRELFETSFTIESMTNQYEALLENATLPKTDTISAS